MKPRLIAFLVGFIAVVLAGTINGGLQGISEKFHNGLTTLSSSIQSFQQPQLIIDNQGNLIVYNPYKFPIQLDLSGRYYTIPPEGKIVINVKEIGNVTYIKIKFLNISITSRLSA